MYEIKQPLSRDRFPLRANLRSMLNTSNSKHLLTLLTGVLTGSHWPALFLSIQEIQKSTIKKMVKQEIVKLTSNRNFPLFLSLY